MLKVVLCCVIATFPFKSLHAQAKVQCSCHTVPADGEGNTSCSAAESRGRCTIDYNLFGPESEKRAADLLTQHGVAKIKMPDLNLSPDESLQILSSRGGEELQDALLIYIAVATGDQRSRRPETIPESSLKGLEELVKAVRSSQLARLIEVAFNSNARQEWMKYSNDALRSPDIQMKVEKLESTTLSPGCIEFQTNTGLWMMFKAKWSPARVDPGCGGPASATRAAFWNRKGFVIGLPIGAAAGYVAHQ